MAEVLQPPTHRWTKAGPVVTALPPDEVQRLEERQEVTAGDPGAMGLFGFAVGTLVIAIVIGGFEPTASMTAAVPAVLVFAGVAQFIAGMWAYRKGNTFAATAFSSYGANNTLVAVFILLQSGHVIGKASADQTLLGVGLFCFAYISLVLGGAALAVNLTFVALLWSLVPGFALAAVYDVGGPASVGHVGGYFLILAAAIAFYAASALVINSTFERKVLPLFPRS